MVTSSADAPVIEAPVAEAVAEPLTSPVERRRDKRYNIALLGRFMRANKQEFPCKLRDISTGGAAIMSPVDLEAGEHIVAYFDHIGGLEGVVVRSFEGGFGLELRVSQHKRDKLAAQLAWLSNRANDHNLPQRRHDRFAVNNKTATLTLDEGISVQVRVLDVSISGASIETEARPPIGNEVVLGKLRARVARHHVMGLGLEFLDIQNPDAVRRYFG